MYDDLRYLLPMGAGHDLGADMRLPIAGHELLIDGIVGAVYYRHLRRCAPLTEEFADRLVDQALRGLRLQRARK
jgi:hypothetical protein